MENAVHSPPGVGFTMCPALVAAVAAAALGVLASGCGEGGGTLPKPKAPAEPVAPASSPVVFRPSPAAGMHRAFAPAAAATGAERFAVGVAVADADGDGDADVYVVGGVAAPAHYYENQGDGTFREVGAELGLAVVHRGSGPAFGDIDNDGDADLFVGAVAGDPVRLFENRLNEAEAAFVDVTAASGLVQSAPNTISATFYDYDRDGFADLFLSHWGTRREPGEDTETLWRNNGDGTFGSASIPSGIAAALAPNGVDWSLTFNLADIDDDGDGDLLVSGDYGTSRVLLSDGQGAFAVDAESEAALVERATGAAIGDFDNDGDLDWFQSGRTSRLVANNGGGRFADAGLRHASNAWGWATCRADFDNDGHLDIAQVQGGRETSASGPIRFLHNTGNGLEFRDFGREAGLTTTGDGRALACFDADRDRDVDLLVVNAGAPHLVLYRNELAGGNRGIAVELAGSGANRLAIGARVTVAADGVTQLRELGGRSNFASHDPFVAHFGIGSATDARIAVLWPAGGRTEADAIPGERAVVEQPRQATLRLSVVQGGGDGVYAPGDIVPIEAELPPEGYFFSHWTSSRSVAFADRFKARTTFRMPAKAVTLTANYTPGVALGSDVSVARRWNEVLLQAIRNDFARPTVHARNLFHIAAATYDAWVAYASQDGSVAPTPWLLGTAACELSPPPRPADAETARHEALSFATYRLIRHRFRRSPGKGRIARDAFVLMDALGYQPDRPSEHGRFGQSLADCYLAFGLTDGANEAGDYANVAYQPVNPGLRPHEPGNPMIVDLNRWQPLLLRQFVDQAGNPIDAPPEFLSPEWGRVVPFALAAAHLTYRERDGYVYWLYHDPGPPPTIDGAAGDIYRWAHALVAVWSAELSPEDGAMLDISPAGIGNVGAYPASFDEYPAFYGDFALHSGTGRSLNPATSAPYAPQVVPRGDYTRVLAEFWADGPDSETPPGHWFVILNTVADHPLLARRIGALGPELDALEWDVKAYFALGGAMHDAAIAAWSIKGFYDYVRPISSIRAMADRGQSSEPEARDFHVDGIALISGFIERIAEGDPLAGPRGEHAGKIKLLAWRGPDAVQDPASDAAGVGWIRAENWWPYQRPTFVTPPFAGYVSGHSTYSRAAAEVLERLTGDAFFPGGMSDFPVRAGEFLVFEDGPSMDLTLQWATYRDAADQCSLSRIWGGIHPPVDDIPGRLIGAAVGINAWAQAEAHFRGR